MNAAEFARKRARIDHQHRGNNKRRRRELQHLVNDARAILVVKARRVVGYRMTTGEIVCCKERFRDIDAASEAIERIQAANWNGHRVPVRAYPCEHCGGWHLTSQSRHDVR